MNAIKASRAGARESTSPQNGRPETVPYVYRQQRGNSYAARIARRNTEAAALLPAYRANPGEYVRRGSRSAQFAAPAAPAVLAVLADPDALAALGGLGGLGGPSWPGFGELGGSVEGRETETR